MIMKKYKFKVFIVILFVSTFVLSIKMLIYFNISFDVNDVFLDELVNYSNSMNSNYFNIVKYIKKIDFNPLSFWENNYTFKEVINKKEENIIVVDKEENIIEDDKPIIYIYNTHQKEKYATSKNDSYNIDSTVLHASFILQEKLKEYNISSIVEKEDISNLLRINGWNYASSYLITEMLLKEAVDDYPTLKVFVDLHRDSVSKSISTAVIDNKSYARVMFVVGMSHSNYKDNLSNANFINSYINTNYPGLSRGVYKKDTSMGNGVYNQHLNSNCFLIEVGGEKNTIEEVTNTISVIAEVINMYLGEKNG